MAAPRGNLNSAKNGTRLVRLVVGNLPSKLFRVQRYVRQYRRGLEDAAIEVHGGVGMVAAHHIDAAVQHEQHAQVCRWLLRQRLDTMSTADVRECSRQMAAAKDARNRAVLALGLDAPPANPWDAIDAPHVDATRPPGGDGEKDTTTDGNASDEPQGAHSDD